MTDQTEGKWLDQFFTPEGRVDLGALELAIKHLRGPDRDARMREVRVFWKTERKHYLKERQELNGRLAALAAERDWLNEIEPSIDALDGWTKCAELILQRPNGSAMHHLRQSIRDDTAVFLAFRKNYDRKEFDKGLADAHCFVVEHDWAKAFQGAGDFSEGDFRLPYDVCAFEFKLSGQRVIALMTEIDGQVMMQIMIQAANHWTIDNDVAVHDNGGWGMYHAGRTAETNAFQHIVEFIGAQVRAISIALDAEVAQSEVVRAPHKLVRSREKNGRVPPVSHHVVSLARRVRAAPLPDPDHTVEHGKVRLHFRRGHWRHYENRKTWIRWTLVGNPDLGFVEKEYRL